MLDTNLVLSALVFRNEASTPLRDGWQSRRFTPLVSRETTNELMRVLTYPNFGLTRRDQEDLLSDYLPFYQTVKVPVPPPPTPSCRDPFDIAFLTLAIAGHADFLVTGDLDLLSLSTEFSCPIIRASEFLARLQPT